MEIRIVVKCRMESVCVVCIGLSLCGVYWIVFVWCVLDCVCVVCIGLSLCGVY